MEKYRLRWPSELIPSLYCARLPSCALLTRHTKQRLAEEIQHRSGMNVLLIGLANVPFFSSEISWVFLALIWDSRSTWTEMTVLVLSKSTMMSCFLPEAQASADSPCTGWLPKCRDWKTRGSEWFLLWVLQKIIRHGKDLSHLPVPVPGHMMGFQSHWVQLRSRRMAETGSAWFYKQLSNVLSFPPAI